MSTPATPSPTETAIVEFATVAINLAIRLFVKNPASQSAAQKILTDLDALLQSIGI